MFTLSRGTKKVVGRNEHSELRRMRLDPRIPLRSIRATRLLVLLLVLVLLLKSGPVAAAEHRSRRRE